MTGFRYTHFDKKGYLKFRGVQKSQFVKIRESVEYRKGKRYTYHNAYINLPKIITLPMSYKGKSVRIKIEVVKDEWQKKVKQEIQQQKKAEAKTKRQQKKARQKKTGLFQRLKTTFLLTSTRTRHGRKPY